MPQLKNSFQDKPKKLQLQQTLNLKLQQNLNCNKTLKLKWRQNSKNQMETTQISTKLKNSICDSTQQPRLLQNLINQIVTKLRNSNSLIVTKLKYSNCDKTQKSNCYKTIFLNYKTKKKKKGNQ